MVSWWFGRDKPAEYYQAELHELVFTLPEILAIGEINRLLEEEWEANLPRLLAAYIEMQVWNNEILLVTENKRNEAAHRIIEISREEEETRSSFVEETCTFEPCIKKKTKAPSYRQHEISH